MFALLVMVIFGIIFSLVATQNTLAVPIQLYSYRFSNIPLYLIALVSLLTGIFLSWSISLFDWIANAFTLRGKDLNIRHSEQEIKKLQNQINVLQSENTALKNEKLEIKEQSKQKIEMIKSDYPRESLINRFRHSLSA